MYRNVSSVPNPIHSFSNSSLRKTETARIIKSISTVRSITFNTLPSQHQKRVTRASYLPVHESNEKYDSYSPLAWTKQDSDLQFDGHGRLS